MDHSPPSKTLEDFIGNLRGPGVESEGEFSLNPQRARELLRSFQLDNPHRYILHLVSFLVGFHPPDIDVSSQIIDRQQQFLLRASDITLDAKHIANPFVGLLRGGSERHYEELAIGLNAAMGIPECVVTIRSGQQLGSYAGEEIVTDELDTELQGIRIDIRRPLKSKLSSTELAQEEELLKGSFTHCPVPLMVNGDLISGSLPYDPTDFEWYLHNPHDPLWVAENEYRITEPHTARFSALVQVGEVAPGLQIIHLGRSYRKPVPWTLAGSGWRIRITIATTRCKKDLSQLDILEEKVYQNLLNHIRNRFLASLGKLMQPQASGPKPPPEFLDLLIDHAYNGGAAEQAYQLQRQQYQQAQNTRSLLQRATAAYRLGLMERKRGHADAEELMAEAGRGFAEWRAPRDLWYEDYPVSPKVYVAWLQLRAHFYLGNRNQELVQHLFDHAYRARGCLPIEATCYRWAIGLEDGEPRISERLRWAQVLHQLKRLEESKEVLLETERQIQEGEVEQAQRWEITELLGQVCAELGAPKEGIKYLSAVLEEKRDRFGNHSVELGMTLQRLIVVLDHTGDTETAGHYRNWVAGLEAQ